MPTLFAFIAGLIFGLGLIVAGMVNPAKIIGFLDIAGTWDPSLALVMVGAIAVGLVAFALARRRTMSALGLPMQLPSQRTVDARLIGGSLIPVSVNLQVGAGHNARGTSGADTVPASTTVLGAVGFSVPLPTPGISIEPYFSPGIRYHKVSDLPAGVKDHQTNFGWVIGGNFSFGLVGIHVAYDSEKFDNGTHGVLGVGADVGLRLPMGL